MTLAARSHPEPVNAPTRLNLCGHEITLLKEGALWWAAERTLVVSDLHLEKGSSFAARGQHLPPYDTRTTLAALCVLVERMNPERVISLGDSFHDGKAMARLHAEDRTCIERLTAVREWVWIEGNHDPHPPEELGGTVMERLALGRLVFQHHPSRAAGTVAGHLHPCARIALKGRAVRRRCFISDGKTLIMPAFGAYTGGLNVLEDPFVEAFPSGAGVFMMGGDRVYAIRPETLVPDGSGRGGVWRMPKAG